MPETVGKYEILERIARGGMGIVFKAYDPVLHRTVALKVISSEVEVTDELRARFFREAQACARLNHPNIVTIFDMGEDKGQLYIAMEFLEGEELRQLITRRTPVSLEDKVSIMIQVCDGLHYAHQKGIVHRDIKPGNILVLRGGQVKILDFGIAQIAAAEGDLTRTGLIMGTLRYISPEQVRGRADQRSDIFSVGAVFYEFLGLRPPFPGDDPIQILEQLSTQEPPPLTQLNARIPVALGAVVQRAMRKDPAERFADLAQTRSHLEKVHQELAEEVDRARVRLRARRDELRELRAALVERTGLTTDDQELPAVDHRATSMVLHALEDDLGERIEKLRVMLARADALAPSLQRGSDLLEAGQFAEAMLELEAIVADMPEHPRAIDALGRARALSEAERRRQVAVKLEEEARVAMDGGEYALCVEILKQAAEISPAGDAAPGIASLRQRADAALATQEAARRARQEVEQALGRTAEARRSAEALAAVQYAPTLWHEAEGRSAKAEAAFARQDYTEAGEAFAAAIATYQRSELAAREARLRERGAAALEQMARAREDAQQADAPRYAAELWDMAEARSAEAQAFFETGVSERVPETLDQAADLYQRAGTAAISARQLERRAEEASHRAAQGQRGAEDVGARDLAPLLWNEAEETAAIGRSALARGQHEEAATAFDRAETLYRRATNEAEEAQTRQRDQAEQARRDMAERRHGAMTADAASHAPSDWADAEGIAASGEAAFARAAHIEASQGFRDASARYRQAEGRAREIVRADVERERERTAGARRAASNVEAAKYAPEGWRAAETTEREASAALVRRDHVGARSLFLDARRGYAAAASAATLAAEAEARRIDAMMGEATQLFASGEVMSCLERLNEVLALRPAHAAAQELRLKVEARPRETRRVAGTQESEGRRSDSGSDASRYGKTTLRVPTPEDHKSGSTDVLVDEIPGRANGSRRRLFAAMAAVGGVAAIALSILFWPPLPKPDKATEPQIAEQQLAEPQLAKPPVAGQPPASSSDAIEPPPSVVEKPAPKPDVVSIPAPPPPMLPKRDEKGAEPPRAVASAPPRRTEAEQARTRTASARRAAEQAAASYYANKLFASARAKERDGVAALGQSDYTAAIQLFAEADATYHMSVQEAKREAEAERRLAPLKADLDESHGMASARRKQALLAEADRLARDLFFAAQARHVEADDLVARQNLPAAAKAYKDAAERYAAAALRADAARARK